MAITKAITYPPRVGFRYGSLRDSGMVSGSKGYGPAGAGGQAMGPSGNQGNKQGGGGKQQPAPTQPAPTRPTQNEILDTALNREITAAGAQITTESGPLTDGKGNMIAQGKKLQDFRDKVAADKLKFDMLNMYNPSLLAESTYDPTLGLTQGLTPAELVREYNEAVGNIQTDNLGLLAGINPNYSAGSSFTSQELQNQTLEEALESGNILASEYAANIAAQQNVQDLMSSAQEATQTKPSPFRNFMDFLQSTKDYFSETEPLDIAKDAAVGTLNTFSNPSITGSLGLGLTGIKTLGNIMNFNPTLDPITGEPRSSIFGDLGTSTYGALSMESYEDAENMTPEGFYRAAFVDPDTGQLYDGTNFEALKSYTDAAGASLKPGMDLAQNLRDQRQRDIEMGGRSGPAEVATTGGDTGTDGDTGDDTEDLSDQSIYNSLSDAEKSTADKMLDLGYDLGYAISYIKGKIGPDGTVYVKPGALF
tara:strand:+ start:161 stop:1594 length:1434 start_codon:yes stop_codon:yes gene_type:complete